MKKVNIENHHDGRKALLFVGFFFALVISANATMYYFAYKSYDGLVEENYYNRALNYQSEKDQETNQEKLGWNINFSSEKDNFILSAKDKNQQDLKDAKVKLTFFRPTQSGFDKTYNLSEIKPGIYENPSIKLPLNGIWDVYIEVKKDTNKWKKKQRISI